MYPNLESYQRQASDLLAKINQMQQIQAPLTAPPPVPPKIDYVKGIEGARKFLSNMPANGEKILMDQDEALLYIVSKDANGTPAPIYFSKFELEKEQEPKQPEYITKEDLNKAVLELKQMLKGDKE